jgi:hypothetical protein
MHFVKKGFLFKWKVSNTWWNSHTMAPSAVFWNGNLRIYFGAWDKSPVSRITYIDCDPTDPRNILAVKDDGPVLDIGKDGTFDENGVFPGHVQVIDKKVFLYYTGFQLGCKVPHYNFGGLAISEDGEKFKRYSKSPVLDRSDEGLTVRAGQSIIYDDNVYKTTYSAGSTYERVGGKLRPCYDVYYQESDNPFTFANAGQLVADSNPKVEHGLGRPQIIKIKDFYYIFYTRRMKNMKYFIGASKSKDCKIWIKDNQIFSEVFHSKVEFDSEMIYFPSVVFNPIMNKFLLFYCGNNFGETGIGYMVLEYD